jgi:nucleoside 2-deoxyribosyltransferase
MTKVYIAGKITGLTDFKEKFQAAEDWLKKRGHIVMNPAILPSGFEYEEYMAICFAMIDACDVVCMLINWADSPGATRERTYAIESGKLIAYQEWKVPNETI